MKVLVFGASGSIGFPVARALVRAGHVVYGQTRQQSNVKVFLSVEIIPVVGDPESDAWHHLIPSVDAVVDCLASVPTRPGMSTHVLTQTISLRPSTSQTPKLTYVYTSGTWMYGHTEDITKIVSDTSVINTDDTSILPLAIVSKRDRAEREKIILTDPKLLGVVIRPGIVFGGAKSLLGPLFNTAAKEARIVWPKMPNGSTVRQRYAATHVDDLADLYVRAAERAQVVGGMTIAATADSGLVEDLLLTLGDIVKAKNGIEYFEASSPYDVAMASTQIIRPYVAKALLGWVPAKPSLVESVRILFLSHLAGNPEFEELMNTLVSA